MKSVIEPEYSTLAKIYDTVMENVDYDGWADFIDDLIQIHHPCPSSVLELACGTGSLSLALTRFNYRQILGTDKSMAMIEKARQKAIARQSDVSFRPMDFLQNNLKGRFDVVVSIFDSINYLQSREEILKLLAETRKVMDAQSVFIFDFTTPKNSIEAIPYLNNEEGITTDDYHFIRKSNYDAEQQIHYNTFEIEKLSHDRTSVLRRSTEKHQQRIYSLEQMQDFIGETDFTIVKSYGEFDLQEATPESLRVTMVLKCPNTPLYP